MARWLYAEYREFYDYPRMMVCTNNNGTFFFLSRFDDKVDGYPDHYEVYRIPTLTESAACSSWFGLETQAIARLPDLPVTTFPFDVKEREFQEYDSILPLLLEKRALVDRHATKPFDGVA